MENNAPLFSKDLADLLMLAAAVCPPLLFVFGYASVWVPVICTASVLLLIFRHKENIKRLLNGSERKFKFK